MNYDRDPSSLDFQVVKHMNPRLNTSTSTYGLADRVWYDLLKFFPLSYRKRAQRPWLLAMGV